MAIAAVVAGNRIVVSDLNAFYNLLKGVTGSGETITLINNSESLIFQPSSDPSAGTRVWTVKNNAGTVLASMRFDGLLKLLSAAAAPASAVVGSIYWDSVLGLQVYNGATWDSILSNVALPASDATLQINYHHFHFEPFNQAGINPVNVGGGSATTALNRGWSLDTGTANPSSVSDRIQLVQIGGGGNMFLSRLRRWEFQAHIANTLASANSYIYLTDESVDTAPSATARHIGIKNLNGTVSFTTADGTTEQTTAITGSVTAGVAQVFVVTYDSITARLYINGTLRTTHATNVPTGTAANPYLRMFIDNNASVNARTMIVLCNDALFAAS